MRQQRKPILLLTTWSLLLSALTAIHSAPLRAEDSVQDILASAGELPWYDSSTDGIRRAPLRERSEPPSPGDWEQSPKKEKQQSNTNWNWDIAWEQLWSIVTWLIYILLGLLVIFAVWKLSRSYLTDNPATGVAAAGQGDRETLAIERRDQLPVDVGDEETDLLTAAREQAARGQFGQAIVYLFSYQLLQLDQRDLLQLVKGKTNRQYLRELTGHHGLRSVLRDTMYLFEDFFFGQHVIDAARFDTCWSQLDQFHALLEIRPVQ